MSMNAYTLSNLAISVYGAMQKADELKALMELALNSPHETILEVGSGHGGTLWAWSHLPNNKTVISVDLPGGAFGGGFTDEDKERIENWMDPTKNTFLCAADSHDPQTYKDVLETLEEVGDGRVDILFIDAGHTYDDVKQDFEMYSGLVKPGGFICFHDIEDHSTTNPACKVDEFWKEVVTWAGENGKKVSEFKSEPHTWGGIGVIHW
jgi:predicted O-methyltransferase YrrM